MTSWLDFAAKMLPGVSLFLRLYQIKAILVKQLQLGIKKIAPRDTSISTTTSTSTKTAKRSLVVFQSQPVTRKRKIVMKLLNNALLLEWGLGILVMRLHASSVA